MHRFLAVLIFLITISARAAVEWSPDLDAALARAKSERTLVLLHLRTDCAICNRSTDRDVQYLEKFPQVVHNLGAFVLARATVSDQPTPTLKRILDQRPPAPALVILDGTGLLLLSWKDIDNANNTASFLTTLRGTGKRLVEAAD